MYFSPFILGAFADNKLINTILNANFSDPLRPEVFINITKYFLFLKISLYFYSNDTYIHLQNIFIFLFHIHIL